MGLIKSGISNDPTGLMQSALSEAEELSGRTDLSSAPLMLYSLSIGANPALTIMRDIPDRVAGFFMGTPFTITGQLTEAMLAIPGYLAIAKVDEEIDNAPTLAFFASARQRGALWALASEPGRKHYTSTASPAFFDALRGFFASVLEQRVRATPASSSALTPLSESSGWLGDQSTFEIATWSTFRGARSTANWFPTQSTAQLWQKQVTIHP